MAQKIKNPTNHLIFLLLSFNAALWIKNEGLLIRIYFVYNLIFWKFKFKSKKICYINFSIFDNY